MSKSVPQYFLSQRTMRWDGERIEKGEVISIEGEGAQEMRMSGFFKSLTKEEAIHLQKSKASSGNKK